jgi:hypothetical protein
MHVSWGILEMLFVFQNNESCDDVDDVDDVMM